MRFDGSGKVEAGNPIALAFHGDDPGLDEFTKPIGVESKPRGEGFPVHCGIVIEGPFEAIQPSSAHARHSY